MIGALLSLAAFVAAEFVAALVGEAAGVASHAVVLFLLILFSSRARAPDRALYMSLTLVPLMRIVSLSMPSLELAEIYWFLIVSLPLFLAILLVVRILRLRASDLGLAVRRSPVQVLIGLTGIGLGWIEYEILNTPAALVASSSVQNVALGCTVLLVSTGLLEELAFRGVMQRGAEESLGKWGWLYVAAVFSTLYIGDRSAVQWLFALCVGLFFGWVVKKTGSLLGVTLGHGVASICLYVALPLVMR